MTLKIFRTFAPAQPAFLLLVAAPLAFFAAGLSAQSHPASAAPESAFGGVPVETIVARVNDQIITNSDYDRAMKEMDDEARQRGASMQQIADSHKDLLRNLIDQQLWLAKGKELDINAETDLVKQLDEIRKRYNLESMEDLEKAAKEQGVSFEDFKANIRNQLITQQVMREEVGRRISVTPGEAQRYFEAHKQDYVQPESVHLAEILISTGTPAPSATTPGAAQPDDPQKLAAAKAKADDIEAQLKAGKDFDALARANSEGPTATEGGDLGKFQRGSLAKVLEDQTFALNTGQFTEPIRTKQGYVILKVVEHVKGGVPQFKDVQNQVEETFYESRMEPAIRTYLAQLREEAAIFIRPGYTDSAATPNEIKPTISYSSYTPPAPKKKKKVERTRFRETEHSFRNKSQAAVVPVSADTTAAKPAAATAKAKSKAPAPTAQKAGKKEKIRFGQAPRETLPNSAETKTEDAGALPKVAENTTDEQSNPLQAAAPVKKTRFAERSKLPKAPKAQGPKLDSFAPNAPDAAEVADRQTQSAPLGLNGDSDKKKKKAAAAAAEKTRMQQRAKAPADTTPLVATPTAPVPGAPAPATAPKPNPTTTSTPGTSAPQQTPTSPDPPQSDLPASEPPH